MLIAVGDKWDRITSWGALSTSPDGLVWSADPINPFNARGCIRGVAASPTNTVVVGDGGTVASSTDLINWHTDKIWQGNFQPLALQYATDVMGDNGTFIAVGQGKLLRGDGPYLPLAEAAQIFRNDSGANDLWELIYSYSDSQNSRFYGVKRIPAPVDMWIAVGSADDKPLGVYSLDSGITWLPIAFPAINGVKYVYDVVFNDNRYWFTANGIVLVTDSITTPNWDASSFITPTYGKADMKQLAVDPISKHMVAAASGGLIYSIDLNTWNMFSVPGYRFRSVTYYNGLWVAGADSNLSTYTYWYSTDGVNWSPDNNKVYIYDFAQI